MQRTWWWCALVLGACGSSAGSHDIPDAGMTTIDSGSEPTPDAEVCQRQTLAELCTAAGYQCGDATFTSCDEPVAGSCGACATTACGGDGVPHKCAIPGWGVLDWPSTAQTRISAMWSTPGSDTIYAGGGGFGGGELWEIIDGTIAIIPVPRTILGVQGTGTDIWAVGAGGTVVHGVDGDFDLMPNTGLTVYDLNAVWGFGASDVWVTTANGVNSVAHWNGTTWTLGMLPSTGAVPGCTGLWASAANDLWTVCRAGEIFHWNGTDWAKVASPTTRDLQAIYGFAANNIWAVGNSNTLLHYNGTSWASVSAPAGGGLFGIWGTAANDVYAVGSSPVIRGRVIHFDGNTWSTLVTTDEGAELDRIAGAQGHIYAAGFPTLFITYP